MIRTKKECPACGEFVSLSNFQKHRVSRSCSNGGKNRTRAEKHPWKSWEIGKGMYRLPCGYLGTKRACTNKLIAMSIVSNTGGSNFKLFNERVKAGEATVHNKGKSLSLAQRKKLSVARRAYHARNGTAPETRKALSVIRKKYLADNPQAHVNARVAGNRSKMTYPERVAYDWFKNNGIEALHNKKVGRYFPDFLVGNVIVEIDGERWHSSPEQVDRDRKRDAELRNMGYTIHRIPAKSRIEESLEKLFLGGSAHKA